MPIDYEATARQARRETATAIAAALGVAPESVRVDANGMARINAQSLREVLHQRLSPQTFVVSYTLPTGREMWTAFAEGSGITREKARQLAVDFYDATHARGYFPSSLCAVLRSSDYAGTEDRTV